MATALRDAQIAYGNRLPDEGPDMIDLACQRYLENADGMNELVAKAMDREEFDEAFVALMSRNDPQPLQNVIAEAFESVTGFDRSYAGWSEK